MSHLWHFTSIVLLCYNDHVVWWFISWKRWNNCLKQFTNGVIILKITHHDQFSRKLNPRGNSCPARNINISIIVQMKEFGIIYFNILNTSFRNSSFHQHFTDLSRHLCTKKLYLPRLGYSATRLTTWPELSQFRNLYVCFETWMREYFYRLLLAGSHVSQIFPPNFFYSSLFVIVVLRENLSCMVNLIQFIYESRSQNNQSKRTYQH